MLRIDEPIAIEFGTPIEWHHVKRVKAIKFKAKQISLSNTNKTSNVAWELMCMRDKDMLLSAFTI